MLDTTYRSTKPLGSTGRVTPAVALQNGLAMTALARSHRSTERPYDFDVRCSAELPRENPAEGRCQLFAGHDGPHALMFACPGKRTVRTWTARNHTATIDAGAEALQRPWMFGYPVPAWFEKDTQAELSH